MSMIDRLGQVVRSEWNARFRDDDVEGHHPDAPRESTGDTTTGTRDRNVTNVRQTPRSAAVSDVEGALRVLELTGTPTLDEVRAAYRTLARRYHPKTCAEKRDDVDAAHTVQAALTDALELLEEHLLPLPPAPSGR